MDDKGKAPLKMSVVLHISCHLLAEARIDMFEPVVVECLSCCVQTA